MKKMFLNLSIFSTVILAGWSCSENEDKYVWDSSPVITLDVTSIPSVNFNDVVTISGVAKSENAVREVSFYLAKLVDGNYERLWFSPLQNGGVSISKEVAFTADVKIDDPEATAIAVNAIDPQGRSTTSYVELGNVAGAVSGSAMVMKNIEMTTEYEYGSTMKSLFSINGLMVDGLKKHVLTIEEVKASGSKKVDFAFINIFRNTLTYTSGALTSTGFAFCEFRQLTRGPIGRQCDFTTLFNAQTALTNTDTTFLVVVNPTIASQNNFDKVFEYAGDNYGTSNFLNLLSGLFASTINYSNEYSVIFKSNTLETNASAVTVNALAGSYIAVRKTTNNNAAKTNPKHRYGLIKITEVFDDAVAIKEGTQKYIGEYNGTATNANLVPFWINSSSSPVNGIGKLFGKPVKFDFVMQQ